MGFMRISVGDRVVAGGSEAVITRVVGADQVMVRDLMTGAVQQIPIRTLQQASASGTEPRHQTDLSLIGDEDWAMAQMRGTRPSNRSSKHPGLTLTSCRK